MILYVNGAGWGNTRTCPGLKKKIPYPLKTSLLNFNPIPLGAGWGGYPKKPAPLPSLSPHEAHNHHTQPTCSPTTPSNPHLIHFHYFSHTMSLMPVATFISIPITFNLSTKHITTLSPPTSFTPAQLATLLPISYPCT